MCSPGNVELVRSLGADHVVDYTRDDFTRTMDDLGESHARAKVVVTVPS